MKQFTVIIRMEPKNSHKTPEYTASTCAEYAMNEACTQLENYGFDVTYSIEEVIHV